MKKYNFNISSSNNSFTGIDIGEFEYANPVEKLFEAIMGIYMTFGKEYFSQLYKSLSEKEVLELVNQKAIDEYKIKKSNLLNLELPKELFKVLVLDKKSEQEKALKSISLTSDELEAFILKAYLEYGFKYSFYRAEFQHKGLKPELIPRFAFIDKDEKIISSGDSIMTDGEIKHMITHRKMTISKFLDKDKNWHCFFFTYKSLGGQETTYKIGQPHLHYISNAFGMSRDKVLAQLKSNNYNLSSSLHIDFYTHRNPKK